MARPWAERLGGVEGEERRVLVGGVGNGVDAAVAVIEADGAVDGAEVLRAIADEVVDGVAAGEGDDGIACGVAKLGEALLDAGGRLDAPAILVEEGAGCEPVPWTVAAAVLAFDGATAEAAAVGADGEAAAGEAALGLNGDGAAEGVESVDGVRAGDEFHRGDGDLGDEIPLDDVAEGLVLADAVEVDGEARGCADERRGGVAAIVDVGLEGVVLILVDVDAVEAALHGVGEIDGVGVFDGLGGERLDGDGDVGRSGHRGCRWAWRR